MFNKKTTFLLSLCCAFLFFTSSIFANVPVNIYLPVGAKVKYSDTRWYNAGDKIVAKGTSYNYSSSLQNYVEFYIVNSNYVQVSEKFYTSSSYTQGFTITKSGYYRLAVGCINNKTNCEGYGSMDDVGK